MAFKPSSEKLYEDSSVLCLLLEHGDQLAMFCSPPLSFPSLSADYLKIDKFLSFVFHNFNFSELNLKVNFFKAMKILGLR